MRVIDRWAGIPLTFILTLILKPWERFYHKRNRTTQPDVQRTLFIELSEMGSAIIVDPAMRKLQTEKDAELFFVIFKDNAKSLNILGTVPKNNIFTMRVDSLLNLAIDIFRFMAWCRERHITTCIDLELFSRFTALLSARSGAPSRARCHSAG